MSRRKRNWLDRSCYHITHRCLDREYLFEHALTRNSYLKELREMIARFNVDVLNYIVTSNHVHILVYAGNGMEIEKGMQYLQGRMAQRYNMRTGREGAFWSGRYHATLIESGSHLSQCLFYIDYNMMRAREVSHPSEWKHSGYHEWNLRVTLLLSISVGGDLWEFPTYFSLCEKSAVENHVKNKISLRQNFISLENPFGLEYFL